MAEQMTPLAALVTNFGGRLPAGTLHANSGAYNAVGVPRHQVWRRDPYWDDAGRQRRRRRLWRSWSPSVAAGSLRMLQAKGGADKCFVNPRHQVTGRAPCWDASGQRRRR